jgi:diguanylate cyclase (GGDEF)-like protein
MRTFLRNLLLLGPRFPDKDPEREYKFVFLVNVFSFAALVAFFMGFVRWQESVLMGMIDFAFSGVAFGLLYYLRFHKEKIELVSTLALIASYLLFFTLYLLAPYSSVRLSLFFLLAASAFFLKGRKKGFIWLAFIILSILAGHAVPYFKTAYSLLDVIITSVYLIALLFIFDKYEAIKEDQKRRLHEMNVNLEETVRARTWELIQANDALKNERRLLEEISSTDQLTGLFNRYKFEDIFNFELRNGFHHKTESSITLLDIDFFKPVNDTHGHNIGDAVLKAFAGVLKSSVRSSDVLVRWGGDEFIIFSPKTSLEEARQLAEIIRQKVKSTVLPYVGHLTISLGVASTTEQESLESLIHRADRALFRAKSQLGDNVEVEMSPHAA